MSRPLPRQGSADSSPFPPTAHLQMDNDNYRSDVSKGSCQQIVCYSIGCDNPATTSVKIPLGQPVSCVIHVCNSCLSKYQVDNDADDNRTCHQDQYSNKEEMQTQ
jgi:hypothetical protein